MRKINLRVSVFSAGSEERKVTVKAYLTKTAGLVVHQDVKWNHSTDKPIFKRNSWSITQYPSGLAAFKAIPTSADAIDIAENDMRHLNWVGFTGVEAVSANDKTELDAMVAVVRTKIAALQKSKGKK